MSQTLTQTTMKHVNCSHKNINKSLYRYTQTHTRTYEDAHTHEHKHTQRRTHTDTDSDTRAPKSRQGSIYSGMPELDWWSEPGQSNTSVLVNIVVVRFPRPTPRR